MGVLAVVFPGLERRLKSELAGEVHFDRFTRGRYATDASHYQITPVGVVVPRTIDEAERAIGIARAEGVTVLPRGGGTSQCGQTVGESLVVDCSKYLNRIVDLDVARQRCTVEPGIVLDDLNRQLKPHGLWFPVDISTASRATIGGMAGNNSCGGRSLRYGTMRDNIIGIDAVLADGSRAHFGPMGGADDVPPALKPLAQDLMVIGVREADEIAARFPKVQRRVGGYNLDALVPGSYRNVQGLGGNDINLAHILVGSEGTLGFSTRIELKLSPLLGRRAVGAVHFGSFYEAMNCAQHIVGLKPIAVELVDRTMIELAGAIPIFKPTLDRFVRDLPEAILLVEFGETDHEENLRRLRKLKELIGDLGFNWDNTGAKWGGVVEVLNPELQVAITEVRTSGLNIMMSMKDQGKPVSFVEDCAVPLEHLADYTSRLTAIFEKHGTRGTWYAHAGSGCLHVRPILNLRLEKDVHAMRAIAEEAFAMVREYKGSHSGEHGDGLVRSEFNEPMFGSRLARAFEEVKDRFDPNGLYNPGKVVRPSKFDDRSLLRYKPDYLGIELKTELDWSAFPGSGGGFQGAVEMCNNNGACRKLAGGAMCPSYRVTRDERDVTRGRANTLRLTVTGQLGPDALSSNEMAETLALCVSCKACRRECPTGVDMARMKIEVLAARVKKKGLSLHDRLVGYLPRYAPIAARVPWLFNLRDRWPLLQRVSESLANFSARRSLPKWRSDIYRDRSDWPYRSATADAGAKPVREVVLFADTFNRYFERENLDAAMKVLSAGGYRIHTAKPKDGDRPLCCGRTFLSAGKVDEARHEMQRTLQALAPFAKRGVPIIGLEPSCLFTFRDEMPALMKGEGVAEVAAQTMIFEEFLAREIKAGVEFPFKALPKPALLHGHCHQKAFAAMGAVESVLRAVPDLKVETVDSSCCGMAGSFGYKADTIDVSLKMGELSLLPAVREAPDDALIVADGTSCRHQIHDGAGREAIHVARVLAMSLAAER
ncbi:FAD-binding and (Fe-S)-binding domain-containing protein [Pseudolabrys sp. FHR47]|uniref:FAD-binding and (Fe-S)-binding domain-containing protein n=1 Tax=Pseudolabrys sp. FHR47 TaxID=2562284 RepID=UPI0010BF5E69|nr:FAD-binding and (Fe-S)-binding domain-containing protein [Pseudolabrys sp. FHR47]